MTEPAIRRATVGMDKSDSSINSVMNSLFTPLSRKRAQELAIGEEAQSKYVARLYHEIDGVDQTSKVATGKHRY